MISQAKARIARYYDANTRRFLRFGEGTFGGAIHRGIWLPGVQNAVDAADTVNRLLIERLRDVVPARGKILDLGCGVGATMARLAQAFTDAEITGVTISGVQAELARRRFERAGLSDRCRVVCDDFGHLPETPKYHAMVSVEAFIHSPTPLLLLGQLTERLEFGGRLLICDDWLSDDGAPASPRAREAWERCLDRFRRGWCVGDIQSPKTMVSAGEPLSLQRIENLDLTPYLHLGRPRDRVIAVLSQITRRIPGAIAVPYWGNMIGGDALQKALKRRWLAYRLLVFERRRAARVGTPTMPKTSSKT